MVCWRAVHGLTNIAGHAQSACVQKPARPATRRTSSYVTQKHSCQGARRLHVGRKPAYRPRRPSARQGMKGEAEGCWRRPRVAALQFTGASGWPIPRYATLAVHAVCDVTAQHACPSTYLLSGWL